MLSKVTNAVGLTRDFTSRSKFSTKRLSQASDADMATADRLVDEMRSRDRTTSIKMLAELDAAKSKMLKDLLVMAAAHEPAVLERSASRLIPLQRFADDETERSRRTSSTSIGRVSAGRLSAGRQSSGGLKKSGSNASLGRTSSGKKSETDAVSDVEMAPPSPAREEVAPAEPEAAV